jgi:hypothetical protein
MLRLSSRRSTLHDLQSAGGTAMQLRVFGRAGIQLSVLGCGAVGGFMVRGDPVEQERTIAWAGPHDFAVRLMRTRPLRNPRPPHPTATLVTIAISPQSGETGGLIN